MREKFQYLMVTTLLVLFLSSPAAAAGYYIGIQGGAGWGISFVTSGSG